MEKLPIREHYFALQDDPAHAQLIWQNSAFLEYNDADTIAHDFAYGYVTYLATEPARVIKCGVFKEADRPLVMPLASLLESAHHDTLAQCVFIASWYEPFGAIPGIMYNDPFAPAPDPPDATIAQCLQESNGRLSYHYQVERLYRMCTCCSAPHAREFRQALWAKKDWAHAEVNVHRLSCGLSLAELIKRYRIAEFTVYPNYAGGMHLFEYFNGLRG